MDDETLLRALSGRASEEERAAVNEWRRRRPENDARYQEVAWLHRALVAGHANRLPGSRPSARETVLRAAAEEGGSPPVAAGRDRAEAREPKGQGWHRLAAILAAAALIVLAFRLGGHMSAREERPFLAAREVATGPRETATVVLDDGTVVHLGARSRLNVLGNPRGRTVSVRGRAFFAVAHDAAHPFKVYTEAGAMTVLGTRFAVTASDENLQVVVVEGHVALTASGRKMRVGPSQMAQVMNGTPLPVVKAPVTGSPAEWVGDFLAFQDTPLKEAAAEIERRYGIRIELLDPALSRRTITAWFDGWKWQDVMVAVCIVADARCETHSNGVSMHSNGWTGP